MQANCAQVYAFACLQAEVSTSLELDSHFVLINFYPLLGMRNKISAALIKHHVQQSDILCELPIQ